MRLNELGDFLAGAFAPIAFLWLVLGFFQQGRELQNSSESLRHQVKEMEEATNAAREQAEAQRQAIDVAKLSEDRRRQLDLEDRAPCFVAKITSYDSGVWQITLTNTGSFSSLLQIEARQIGNQEPMHQSIIFAPNIATNDMKEVKIGPADDPNFDTKSVYLNLRATNPKSIETTQKFFLYENAIKPDGYDVRHIGYDENHA
ncbi:MAG: hypothetical protein Q4G14_02355 [Paracoccus sp. (in: a-proteobacteria)]|uniref:hypothetical protein n=1 Tax=Paracoccus sp. TaxID=267 RepID=UPI0026E06896|nr:hypothetical protein [Paracoccus sp. (in: a-proteobacteria)]MDO5612066.1 hypothetical protein [Paracoccus sp. (in: a-proteobacteria)]